MPGPRRLGRDMEEAQRRVGLGAGGPARRGPLRTNVYVRELARLGCTAWAPRRRVRRRTGRAWGKVRRGPGQRPESEQKLTRT
jgi:hypothetical protein